MTERKKPSTQIIVDWVIQGAPSQGAPSASTRLDIVCNNILSQLLPGWSPDEIAELVEQEMKGHLPEALRNERANRINDGGTLLFYIDDENPPYIKRINEDLFDIASRLKELDPKIFEELCSNILEKLGGISEVTGKTDDGGVDFYATGIKNFINQLPLPKNSAICIIGQAKRYSKNQITETDLRKFIGGALLKLDELKRNNSLGLLSPVIFAFWTSFTFNPSASKYAKSMGIWIMDGTTLAEYVSKLKISLE